MNKFRLIKLGGLLWIGLVCLIGLVYGSAQASPEGDRQDYVIDAFLHDPQIQSVLDDFDKQGLVREKPQAIGVGGSCGVAGCGYSALVAQSFYSPGANPQTFSVFALVHVDPFGRVVKVGRVTLQPWQEMPFVSETVPALPRKLEVINKLPAPMPTPKSVNR